MRTIIAGSRTFGSYTLACKAIEDSGFKISRVVCGGAAGADLLGKVWAMDRSIPVDMFRAEWQKYGRSAGPIRNEEMSCNADALILLWDGKSTGSAHMLATAKAKGLKIHVFIQE